MIMKRTKRFLAAMLLVLVSVACTGQDRVISVGDLPKPARELLNEHFKDKQIALVQKDKDGLRTNYDIVFSDGMKMEFDSKGEWTEIDGKPQAVPAAMVPKTIADYVAKTYPGARIQQIDRDRRGYEVELSNGLDVKFNKKLKVVSVDD